MNFKGCLVLVHASVQPFGLGSSPIQTKGFQGERGCRAQRIWVRVPGQCPLPHRDWQGSLLWLDLQSPLLPPSFLLAAPATASSVEEKVLRDAGGLLFRSGCSRAADPVRTPKPAQKAFRRGTCIQCLQRKASRLHV